MVKRHNLARGSAALVLMSGCFLDHGPDAPTDLRPIEFVTVCSEGPAHGLDELVFYGTPGSCESLRCDATVIEDISGGLIELTTERVDGECAGTESEIGRCALPITSVGGWRVRIDHGLEIVLSVPYEDAEPLLGQCFTAGGECLQGVAPGAAGWPLPEQGSHHTVTAFRHIEHSVLGNPPPAYCTVRAVAEKIEVEIRYANETGPGCSGWSRDAPCHLPPLPEGVFAIEGRGEFAAEGVVTVEGGSSTAP